MLIVPWDKIVRLINMQSAILRSVTKLMIKSDKLQQRSTFQNYAGEFGYEVIVKSNLIEETMLYYPNLQ